MVQDTLLGTGTDYSVMAVVGTHEISSPLLQVDAFQGWKTAHDVVGPLQRAHYLEVPAPSQEQWSSTCDAAEWNSRQLQYESISTGSPECCSTTPLCSKVAGSPHRRS